MRPATSTYLDFLRIAAALFVFVDHCAQFWNPKLYAVTGPIAHHVVIVFFVLSGYVIAYSTLARERDAKRFVVARLSRLYSVVAPALVLTIVLQIIGSRLNPGFYFLHSRKGSLALRYLFTSCFLQNIWIFSTSPPTNPPFWSLCYEFWYYALFGAAVLIPKKSTKYLTILGMLLIVGFNVVLLLPCWVIGVALFVYRDRIAAVIPKSGMLFALSVLVMLAVIIWAPLYPYDLLIKYLWYSSAFLTDWVMALTVAATIVFFDKLQLPDPPAKLVSGARYFGDTTFPLYLYHVPILLFITALIPFDKSSPLQVGMIVVFALFIILLLSAITESKRKQWRNFFEACYDRVVNMIPKSKQVSS